MGNTKQYYAFISYKREDETWAKWLQNKLEYYKLPSNLNGRSDLPKEIRPVFRDKSELAAGVLAEEINNALVNSKYIIVICSPQAAQSQWVGKEVQTFIEMGRTDKIIPFIVGGEPHSENLEEECLPLSLRKLPKEQELLGVNINEMGRDAAAVKVVARMFGLRFDDLWQRHEREKRIRRHMITTGIIVFALMVLGVAGWIWHQNVVLKEKDWKMMESQSKLVAEMIKLNVKDDSYLARLAALEVLPKDVSNPVDRPYTAEAERALREANKHCSCIFKVRGVSEAVWSPDGRNILYSSYDSTLTIVDVETFDTIQTIKMEYFTRYFNYSSVCYNRDGSKILTSNDNLVVVYDSQTGAKKLKIIVDTAKINSAKYSPDEKKIITTSGNSMKVWDAETGDCLKTIVGKRMFIHATYSSDGKQIAALTRFAEYPDFYDYSDTNRIIIYNAETYNETKVFNKQQSWARQIVFSNDGQKLLIPEETTELIDINTGDVLLKINTGDFYIDMEFSQNGQTILSKSFWTTSTQGETPCSSFKIWDANDGKEIGTFNGHKGFVLSSYFNRDGNKVISCSVDNTIRIWDVNVEDKSRILINNEVDMYNNILCTDMNIVGYANDDSIVLCDIDSGEEKYAITYDDNLISMDIIPDTDTLLYVTYYYGYVKNPNGYITKPDESGEICKWDLKYRYTIHLYKLGTGEEIKTIRDTMEVVQVAISPDGKRIAYNTYLDEKLLDLESDSVLWSVKCAKYLSNFQNISEFSSDGSKILITGDGIIKFLDANTGETLVSFEDSHIDNIWDAKYSPDGKTIVTCSDDNTLMLWDAESGKRVNILEGHTSGVLTVCFSPDGKYIASGSKDKTISVWEIETGVCVDILKGHNASITNISFTSDGKHIISISNNTVRIWDFPPLQELIDQTRERFKNRKLTEEERKMYYLE